MKGFIRILSNSDYNDILFLVWNNLPVYVLSELYVYDRANRERIKKIITSSSYLADRSLQKQCQSILPIQTNISGHIWRHMMVYNLNFIFEYGKAINTPFYQLDLNLEAMSTNFLFEIWSSLYTLNGRSHAKFQGPKRYIENSIFIYYACHTCDSDLINYSIVNEIRMLKNVKVGATVFLKTMSSRYMYQNEPDLYPAPFVFCLMNDAISHDERTKITVNTMKRMKEHFAYSKPDIQCIATLKFIPIPFRIKILNNYKKIFTIKNTNERKYVNHTICLLVKKDNQRLKSMYANHNLTF